MACLKSSSLNGLISAADRTRLAAAEPPPPPPTFAF
jgi:hypothetical protein